MPDIRQVLREEILRLTRKEVRDALAGVQRENRELRRAITELRRRLAAVERNGASAVPASRRGPVAPPSAEEALSVSVDESALGARINSKMIKRMRERLGLTQAALAALLGVSAQTVYQWERKNGPLQLRGRTRAAVVEVRSLGKREAMRRLGMAGAGEGFDQSDDDPAPDPEAVAPKTPRTSGAGKRKQATSERAPRKTKRSRK